MEYYSLDENHASRTLSLRFTGGQNPYQLQNLKILSTFQGHKNPHGQNFWNLIFFSFEKKKIMQILPGQKPVYGYIIFIHKSYNEIVDKLYLLAQKQGKSEILLFSGKQYLTFGSNRPFIFSGFIMLQGMMQVN